MATPQLNMVAKVDEPSTIKPIPTEESEWPSYKNAFLAFADHKRFGNAIRGFLQPVANFAGAPFSAEEERYNKALESRSGKIADAWFYLLHITQNYRQHLIIPRQRSNPDQPHLCAVHVRSN